MMMMKMMMWIESYATVLHTAHRCEEKSMNGEELDAKARCWLAGEVFEQNWLAFFKDEECELLVSTIVLRL